MAKIFCQEAPQITKAQFLRERYRLEYDTLEKLYHTNGGKEWKRAHNWLKPKLRGQWENVQESTAGFIDTLDFSKNNMTGEIDRQLFNRFRHLESLRVEGNSMHGRIPFIFLRMIAYGRVCMFDPGLKLPKQLDYMATENITKLNLMGRGITGSHEILINMAKLKWLDISENEFTGPVSEEFFDMTCKLDYINMAENEGIDQSNLLGWIPCNHTRLYDLEVMEGSDEGIEGDLLPLAKLKTLTGIFLDGNALSGFLDPVAHLPNVMHCHLDRNWLEGRLPMELVRKTADDPRELKFGGNKGFNLPPIHTFETLPHYCQVDLSNCELSDELPIELIRVKLRWWCRVDLSKNKAFTLPKDMSPLLHDVATYGEHKIVLDTSCLVGDVTPLAIFPKLEQLNLYGNELSGEVIDEVFDLICMSTEYDFTHNKLVDKTLAGYITMNLKNVNKRRHFDFRNLNLIGFIPTGLLLQKETKNCTLELSGNKGLFFSERMGRLAGKISTLTLENSSLDCSLEHLSSVTSIVSLIMPRNKLHGTLDPIATLGSLTDVNLSDNKFTGGLQALASMKHLTRLDLKRNSFSGSLDSIAELGPLTDLDLRMNEIDGTLEPFVNLTNLISVQLSNNRMTGSTEYLGGLVNCKLLELWNNRLTGTLMHFAALTRLEVLWLNNDGYTYAPASEFQTLYNEIPPVYEFQKMYTENYAPHNAFDITAEEKEQLQAAIPSCCVQVTGYRGFQV